jgi:hypothetical protein
MSANHSTAPAGVGKPAKLYPEFYHFPHATGRCLDQFPQPLEEQRYPHAGAFGYSLCQPFQRFPSILAVFGRTSRLDK